MGKPGGNPAPAGCTESGQAPYYRLAMVGLRPDAMVRNPLTRESPGSHQGNAMKFRRPNLLQALALSLGLATPALAQPYSAPPEMPGAMPGAMDAAVDAAGNVYGDAQPEWRAGPDGVPQPGNAAAGYARPPYDDQARASWLGECRRRQGHGKTVGGVVLGGIVGGVLGNRIAGRGNRTAGSVVGAAAGAAVGGVIGSAADSRDARDYCESYLDRYVSQQNQGGYRYGYGYQPVMMVPVMLVAVGGPMPQQRGYTETVVTEEWVTETVAVPRRHGVRRPCPDKRVRVVADKRVRL